MIADENHVNAALTQPIQWESIKWDHCEAVVKKLQVRIAKATRNGNYHKVKSLQWLLTHSYSAKCLAVRKVMLNKGKNTPGVDGHIITTDQGKGELVNCLKRRGYRAKPLRRVHILKADGKSKRPLGIPTIKDRSMQALYSLAVTPVAEVTADGNSYGFRPERSCADAIEQCFKVLASRVDPQWILEADIKGCFDNISHEWMLKHILLDKWILKQWLRAGYIETGKLFPTESGSPQGGLISPVLSNLVLDGIEALLKDKFGNRPIGINLIRYADDFIITAKTKECLEQQVKPLLIEFLEERGLQLSLKKTRITHITEGFDFLGQNVRKYPNGRNRYKLLIKPSKDNIKTFMAKIRKLIRKSRGLDQVTLIKILNSKIRGWANYHRFVVSKEIFSRMDYEIWTALWKWSKWRHPQKSAGWILNRYFQRQNLKHFCFSGLEKLDNGQTIRHTLTLMSDIPIRRHIKIKLSANPFDPDFDAYYERRTSAWMKRNSKGRGIAYRMIKNQHGTCTQCRKAITMNDNWQLHLLTRASRGGSYRSGNLAILHDKCHRDVFTSGSAESGTGHTNKV